MILSISVIWRDDTTTLTISPCKLLRRNWQRICWKRQGYCQHRWKDKQYIEHWDYEVYHEWFIFGLHVVHNHEDKKFLARMRAFKRGRGAEDQG